MSEWIASSGWRVAGKAVTRHSPLATWIFLLLLLAACGRDRVTPTPIPASVVRPVQPTPVYGQSTVFRLTPVTAEPVSTPALPKQVVASRPRATPVVSVVLPVQQNPSALGIVTGGAALLDQPGGATLVTLPTGATVTVTGKAADGRYLAVYGADGQAGWISAGQLRLFGADDLVVVEESFGPGPIATLLADALQPVRVLEQLMVTPVATTLP